MYCNRWLKLLYLIEKTLLINNCHLFFNKELTNQ